MTPSAVVLETGSEWVNTIRFANQLLRSGQRVLQVTGTLGGERQPEAQALGDFVVPLSRQLDPGLEIASDLEALGEEADEAGVQLRPWDSSNGMVVAPLRPVVVGLYGGGGAPFNQAAILAACGFALRFLSDAESRAGALDEVDALVVPGGGFRAMHGQIEPLGEAGCRAIADWVRRGGTYIGSCAGSYACALTPESFVASCPAQRHLQLINARVWNDAPLDFGSLQSPGVGVVTVRNERPDHPVMFGLPESFEIAHYNGPIFDAPVASVVDGASEAVGLAAFSGWRERFTPAEAFMGPAAAGETLLQRAIAAGRYSIVAGYLGAGRVVAFGSHPEFGFDLPMMAWSLPARMLANAVLWQAAAEPHTQSRTHVHQSSGGPMSFPVGSALAAVGPAAGQVREVAAALQTRSIDPAPGWLTPAYAMSFFGETPDRIWTQSLEAIASMASEICDRAESLQGRVAALMATQTDGEFDRRLLAAIEQIERWVLDERPPEWHQDGGYQGVLALLRTASRMCDEALARWDTRLGPPDGAYSYLHENPYHLVAGSYLAAVGCVGGALSLLRALDDELTMAERLAHRERRTETELFATTLA
jgi:Biotin-protein ligase, N terminal